MREASKTNVFEVEGLAKTYAGRRVVDGLSFTVPRGQIYGVLGPNGAGKSTTMRAMVGIISADEGAIRLNGGALTREALQRLGYLPEERGLYRNMTPRAAIVHLARLKGMSLGAADAGARALLEEAGLGAFADKKLKALSKGMAQRVQIVAAIAHQPDVVIFDEPFSGLDPVNQRNVEALVRRLAAEGATVVFSTHIMEHAERICDRIVLIAQGKQAFEGAVADALALVPRMAHLETEGGFDLAAALAPQGWRIEADGEGQGGARRWRAHLAEEGEGRRLLAACVAAGAPLTAFEPSRASLHDAFVHLVGDRVSHTV